ncbi:hypothetical protein PRIC1_007144 [Phytophthora ramorum]
MHLNFLLVVVLVFTTNCYGLSMKKTDDNSRAQVHSIRHGDHVSLGQSEERAHHAELSTSRFRDLQSVEATSAAKPMNDVQSEERGPNTSVLKTLSQKNRNSVFSRFKGLLGKNPTKLTQKNVENIKENSKLKGLLSKNPSTLSKKSAGRLGGYLAKNGLTQIYSRAVIALFGAGALAALIYVLYMSISAAVNSSN